MKRFTERRRLPTRHTSTPKGRFVLRADSISPQHRFFGSTRSDGTTFNNAPFNEMLNPVTFGRILSAPTECPIRRDRRGG